MPSFRPRKKAASPAVFLYLPIDTLFAPLTAEQPLFLFELFIREKVYLPYARKYLAPFQLES